MAMASSRTSALLVGMALRDDSERERQHERRQPQDGAGDGGDRRFLFILRPPAHGMPQPIPGFDGDHHDEDRAAKTAQIGRASKLHGDQPRTCLKNSAEHLKFYVIPVAAGRIP